MNNYTTNQVALPVQNERLGNLHEISRQWLEEISFMMDETTFLDALLTRSSNHDFPTIASVELGKELNAMKGSELGGIKNCIIEHETMLVDAMRSKASGMNIGYHERHEKLARQMKSLRAKFRDMKKKLYSFLRRRF